jgi:hypothetical protein
VWERPDENPLQRFSITALQRIIGNQATSVVLRRYTRPLLQRAGEPKKITSGSGIFQITDIAGTIRHLSIKGSDVYQNEGKKKVRVGSIDAAGRYDITLEGQRYVASLSDLPVGSVQASFTEKQEKKTIRSMEIGKEKANGDLHFPDGTYFIRDNALYRVPELQTVGTLEISKSRSGPGRLIIDTIRYRYVDRAGKEQSGDLLAEILRSDPDPTQKVAADPRTGSVLKLGKGGTQLVFVDKAWTTLQHTKSGFGGFEQSIGGRLDDKLRAMLKSQGGQLGVAGRKIALTEQEIELLQSVADVESSGQVNSVNTWDSDVVSMGFMQYTMAGKLQDLIRRAPGAFARYGIQLGGKMTITSKKGNPKVDGILGAATDKVLRGPEWAARFLHAGLDDEIIAAQVEQAKEKDLPIVTKQINRVPVQSRRIRGILLELHNNRPAYLKAVIDDTLKLVSAKVSEADFIAELDRQMQQIYMKYRVRDKNGSTDEKARAKAHGIVTKIRQ